MASKKDLKAVILDLDQTLTSGTGSWLELTSLLGADPEVHKAIYSNYKDRKIEYEDAKRRLIHLWKITGKTNKDDLSNVFSKIRLREGVYEAINYLKSKYRLCIISGAIDIFVNQISSKLRISSAYASTKFIFDNQGELIDFDYLLDKGEQKLVHFHDYCKKHNIAPVECAAIGDGESDMPIFAEVGLPILFLASETTEDQKAKVKTQIKSWSEIMAIL